MGIKFGPSGISQSFYDEGHKSSAEMPEWLHKMGLEAYEYSFSRGVRISEKLALQLKENAEKFNITITIHAPYYINLAAAKEEKIKNSKRYIIESLTAGNLMGAKRLTFHPGSASLDRREALDRAKRVLKEVIKEADDLGLGHITLCPETMGKKNQLGTLEEVLELCQLDERLLPTVDFAHLHARDNGRFKSIEDYEEVLNTIEKYLGKDRAKIIHVHFSRIEFTEQGEKRHWTLLDKEYGPEFEPLAQLFYERNMEPIVICESRERMAEDALELKRIYQEVAKRVSKT